MAVINNEIAQLKRIAGAGFEKSLLQEAIWESQGDIIWLLLQRGADPYDEIFGYSAFDYARNTYRFAMLRILCDYTEEPFSLCGDSLQRSLAQLEEVVQQMVRELIHSVMGGEDLVFFSALCEESWEHNLSPLIIEAVVALRDQTLPATEEIMEHLYQQFQNSWEGYDWSDG